MNDNILHVTTAHGPFDSRIFQKEARSLAAADYRVCLATTVAHEVKSDGVLLLPLGLALATDTRLARIPRNLKALMYMFRRFDIIHIHDPELLLAAAITMPLGRRIVYDVHEFYHETIRKSHWLPSVLRPIVGGAFNLIERTLLPHLAGVVVVSPEMVAHYAQYIPLDRIAVVRNYPNISSEEYNSAIASPRPLSDRYILHTGGCTKNRAFDIMISAAEHSRKLGKTEPIISIGNVDLSAFSKSEQQQLLERAHAADVRVLGRVDYEESLRWIAHAHIGYMPLALTENNARGMPQKLFEYFRFGLPVVACDFGTVREIVVKHKAGLLVKTADPRDHAEAFARLISDSALRHTLVSASSIAGTQYSFEKEVVSLEALYEGILHNAGS